MTNKLRNTCLFYVVVIIIAPALLYGLNILTHNLIVSMIITSLIVIPIFFIEPIIRLFRRKSRDKKQEFLICPRCNIPVEKELGICTSCGRKL